LHQITYTEVSRVQSRHGFDENNELFFEPHSLILSHLESAFAIYGDKGILVGNMPSKMDNMRERV